MNRNSFIKRSVAAGMGLCVLPGDLFIPAIKGTRAASAVTSGPKHHFFGYYGISPWNKSERSMLCLEVNQQDAMPVKGETAKIVLIDTISNKLHTIAETKAWNYQQGAMIHWNPLNPEDEIYFNDNIDHQIVTRKYNIQSGNEQILTRPVNGLSHNGKYALSLDFGRLGRLRGVVGYSGIEDLSANDPAPENEGIWLMNMQTGESKLIVNYRQVYDLLENRGAKLNGAHLWFNHVVFNKSDNRFFFLHEHVSHGKQVCLQQTLMAVIYSRLFLMVMGSPISTGRTIKISLPHSLTDHRGINPKVIIYLPMENKNTSCWVKEISISMVIVFLTRMGSGLPPIIKQLLMDSIFKA